MQADYRDLSVLLNVQEIDLKVMQIKKKRAELPQRIKVMRLRKKRAEISAKLDQVLELQADAEGRLSVVEEEDAKLAEKQQRAQELIDASGTDYRSVESHSREMAGTAKRRDTLAEQILGITSELEKISSVREKIEQAIAITESEESSMRASFEAEDGALVSEAEELSAKRAELIGSLPADLVALYEKTALKRGGVAIGRLDENTCGICRTSIDGGRLIELKASAPLGTCPNCHRLLVVE